MNNPRQPLPKKTPEEIKALREQLKAEWHLIPQDLKDCLEEGPETPDKIPLGAKLRKPGPVKRRSENSST